MRFRRCPAWLIAALCIAVVGPGGQTLFAQGSLPQNILQAQADLSAQEKSTVDTFVDAQVARLKSNDPAEVAAGRANLFDQFNLSTSQFFLDYYRQSVAQRITPLVQPDQPLMTRLNVAIISAKLSGASLVGILQTGAADPSPAVRYWIAKAIGGAAKAKAFDAQQQQDVLNSLAQRLKDEDSSLVLEQVMVAIAEIDLREAIPTVLNGLDSRVTFHQNNPKAPFKPVQGGMQQLYRKLVEQRSGGTNVTNELHNLARIAFRYYTLIGDQLEAISNEAPADDTEAIKQDKAVMAGLCGQVMDYVVRDVAKLTPPQPVATNNAAQLKASAALWRDILKAPPFNFTDEQFNTAQ
ncbi:MAG: hypothetical protein R3C45_18670 [Phycisphaerales bacterium]